MKRFFHDLKISVNDKIYIKDPESSILGKRIVENSILLINEIGFEHFTFKKLGQKINSPESSIYRYFENKHKLLVYLTSWYWGWKEYQLAFYTTNLDDPADKLLKAVEILTQPVEKDSTFNHIDEIALNQILINESSKSYLTKKVDIENREGYFGVYKRLISHLGELIKEAAPTYNFPKSLASMVLEGSLHQHFLIDHFSSITDCNEKVLPSRYFQHLIKQVLEIK